MSDPLVAIKAGEPEPLAGYEQGGTWRIPLNIEPNLEWRRRFLRTVHADGLFADRKIAVQCAALIVELDGAPLSLVSPEDPALNSHKRTAHSSRNPLRRHLNGGLRRSWRRTCWNQQGMP